MTQIDEFKSLFQSAAKPVFHIDPVSVKRVLVVVDDAVLEWADYLLGVERFLLVLNDEQQKIETRIVEGSHYQSVSGLLELIQDFEPDLICTYRNLRMAANEFPYSLGVFVDVLTQATSIPVLLLPRPDLVNGPENVFQNTDRVLAVTDHLAGDSRLVTYAALFTQDGGKLTLAHIEDEQAFNRLVEVLGKIPSIDTEPAKVAIGDQLLKEPRDYIESCRIGIEQAGLPIEVQSVVMMGHHLADYRQLILDSEADLLVFNTKDEDQLAMHGLAYPLSVEFRDLPLLLI